ncbi:MAG: adenine methylase [Methylophaga sp.]|nr:MAG: adenine methylase [Methylophaga sp.]
MDLPSKKYQIIYADPPWSYRDKCNAGKRGASHKYRCMELSDLMQLQVKQLAADDCVLFMWHVPPMPLEALKVVEAWGFKLKTMKGFTWHKLNKKALTSFLGMGSWTRANTEDCLIAVRGNPKRINASVRQFIESPHAGHSAKPLEIRDRIVQLMGDVPRIELFARQKVEGWDCWGDEV